MRLQPGEQLVRLAAVTAANLGSAAGEATLDRPTQKRADHPLPYVPDSALKGVFAGAFGDVPDHEPNPRREEIFGSPDRQNATGRPAAISFGNAELLAFPVPTREGPPLWIVPAGALARALWLEGLEGSFAALRGLLAQLEAEEGEPLALASPALPPLPPPMVLRPLPGAGLGEGLALLERYLGRTASTGRPLAVVGSPTAATLWRQAAELRTLTALDGERRTVAAGSLRTVELIPPGTVFLSLVSVFRGREIELPGRIALGAWESAGLGWFGLSPVAAAGPAGNGASGSPPPSGAEPALSETGLMVAAHQAVRELAAAAPPWLAKARAAVYHFGPRAQYQSPAAALAFSLAKAKPERARTTGEIQAHRWLLAALLTLPPPPADAPAPGLVAWAEEAFADPVALEARRHELLRRWLWLRRYAELYWAKKERGEA